MKYSVIGTSNIVREFIEGASLVPDLQLLGVYSRTKDKGEKFKEENNGEVAFSSFQELLNSESDFVYVASPNSCHFEQCKALLENGKNVLCEKPICPTKNEFLELKKLADEKNLVYFEAIMYMHSLFREKFKKAVSEIGKIRSATIDFSQLSSKYEALLKGENPNIFNPKMKTGALNDLGIYCVYPIIDLFGEPEKIIPTQSFLETGADGCGGAVFEYSDKMVTVTYSKVGQSRAPSQIMGDKGTVTIGSISKLDEIFIYDNKGNKTLLVPKIEKSHLMKNEAEAMVEFLGDREKYREKLSLLHSMNERVLGCMEKMRVLND